MSPVIDRPEATWEGDWTTPRTKAKKEMKIKASEGSPSLHLTPYTSSVSLHHHSHGRISVSSLGPQTLNWHELTCT